MAIRITPTAPAPTKSGLIEAWLAFESAEAAEVVVATSAVGLAAARESTGAAPDGDATALALVLEELTLALVALDTPDAPDATDAPAAITFDVAVQHRAVGLEAQ